MPPADSAPPGRIPSQKAEANHVLLIGKDPHLGRPLEEELNARNCVFNYAAGSADALRHLRKVAYGSIITDPKTSIEEDLALLLEMRAIRPGVRVVLLAPSTTPEEVIAAMRARVFVCISAPFDPSEIAGYAAQAAATVESLMGIEVVSAHRDWVSVRMNCQMLTGERLIAFLNELQSELPQLTRKELMSGFREVLIYAMEQAEFQAGKVVEVAAVRTARTIVFYVNDPGAGFRWEAVQQAGASHPSEHTRQVKVREPNETRPGEFGTLVTRGVVDEIIYSEMGNEVLLIKHLR